MKELISKKCRELPLSGIRKVNELAMQMEREGNNVIHLEVGRPDFDTPKYIKEACKKSLDEGNVFYTSNYGTNDLRDAIANKLKTQNNIDYTGKEILVTVGLSEAIFDTLSMILDKGDEILLPNPAWANYFNIPKYLGATVKTYDLLEENDFQIDFDELISKISDNTKAIVIITPNNPTGSILKRETLERLAKIAIEKDITILSDEVYERIIYDNEKHFSIASIEGMKERTITFNGFSKTYSMTGWRLGYIAGAKDFIEIANRLHQHITTCAPSFVQEAGIAALTQEKDEVNVMVSEYKRRRDYLVNRINGIGKLSCSIPKGAFYLFVNIKEYGMTSEEFAKYMLEEAHVAMVPGNVFGSNGEGYVRISYASSYDNLVEACERMEKAVLKL